MIANGGLITRLRTFRVMLCDSKEMARRAIVVDLYVANAPHTSER